MSLVEIRHFSYTYPGEDTPVLKDLHLSIPRGSFTVITGKSGCGKSTLGKAMAGFLFHDEDPQFSGQITVNDTDMTQVPLYETSERVGYVQQNPEDQFCTLSVMDEIAFGLENRCVDPEEIDQRIDQALAVVQGLELKDRSLANLSGGEKQKIAIASMLALSPDVLILDEPTSNLDPVATQTIFTTLHHMREELNLTVVIIEHKLAQLDIFRPDLYLLEAGKLQPIQGIPKFKPHSRETKQLLFNGIQKSKNPDPPLIALTQVDVELGDVNVLHNINMNLYPGEFVALLGPNGGGKSTLLQTMMGFHKIKTGSCFTLSYDISNVNTSVLVQDIGFIFQNPDHQLFTHSVWEEAVFTSQNLGILTEEREFRARDWLNQMGLANRLTDHPQRLSYGEKRRLNLIAALLHDPKLLLIDEFLIGQDMTNAHTWMTLLQDYTRQANSVLLVNHHAEFTRDYCDRIVFLANGEIIVDDPVETAFNHLDSSGYSAFLPLDRQKLSYA